MSEKVYAAGKMFELVHIEQPDGRVFEVARRAPGVRLIIADLKKRQVLLTCEYRRELDVFDYRLPGGKVFDTLEEFETFRKTGADIVPAAAEKAIAEAREEAGVDVTEAKFFKKSTESGAELDQALCAVNKRRTALLKMKSAVRR